MEDLLGLRLVNSVLAGAGDLCALGLCFWLLRIRSPRLRRVLLGLGILHCVSALFLVSPMSVLSVQLLHDGRAPWYDTLLSVNFWTVTALAIVAVLLLAHRLWAGARSTRVLRLLAELQPLPAGERLATVARVALRLNIPTPRLVVLSGMPMTPFVAGLTRPLLVVPVELNETLDDDEWEAVVVHELMHLRHHDTWRNFGLEVLRTVLWFHLPLQLLVRRYRQELEKNRDLEACDLLGTRRALASGLVKVSARVLRPSSVLPVRCAAHSSLLLPRPHQTLDRVRSLARASGRWRGAVLCLQVALLVFFMPWQPSSARNPICVGFHAQAGGAEQHSTLMVSAGMTSNPLNGWLVGSLIPDGLTPQVTAR